MDCKPLKWFHRLLILLPILLLLSCGDRTGKKASVSHRTDLPDIRARGTLNAITGYGATSYYIYRGKPMGFEYDLLTRLSEDLGLKLNLVLVRDRDQLFEALNRGDGDLVALGLTITQERRNRVDFVDPLYTTRQVLVQRKPENWRRMKLHEIEQSLIRDPVELIGREVCVRRETSYYSRLINLSQELGDSIHIRLMPGNLSTEELIDRVSRGEIELTVADEHIARMQQAMDRNIDIRTPLSLPQRIAWAVRRDSPVLRDSINQWLARIQSTADFQVLFEKYFENRRSIQRRLTSSYSSLSGGKLSPWDDTIRAFARELNWDWRLLASQIYQESQFDPKAKSWSGAQGLMQLMPSTAKKYGITDITDPMDNLQAGTRHLLWLQDYWSALPDSLERLKFLLASYNVGHNHVQDARRLAGEFGADSNRWDDQTALWLERLADPQYYNHAVVYYGYCRGEEPVRYVEEILDRYDHYTQLIPE